MTVVLCSWGNAIGGGSAEALTLARKLAEGLHCPLHWLVFGELADAAADMAGRFGVEVLDVVAGDQPGPDALVAALAAYCADNEPRALLFGETAEAGGIAARLAGRVDVPVVANVFDVEVLDSGFTVGATAFGGDTRVEYRVPAGLCVLSLAATGVAAQELSEPRSVQRRELTLAAASQSERFAVVSRPSVSEARLEDAEVIIAGGRGLGSKENFELVKQLAEALGGMWAGSRAIVDDGWIDASRQVGLTGKITRPRLYLAVGISGASQHMAGCSAANTIVAINKDADASVFRYARYGIVGDCLEVLPELIRAARA